MTPDDLEKLARATQQYEPPWDLIIEYADLAPAAEDWFRAITPNVILALLAERRLLRDALEEIERDLIDVGPRRRWASDRARAALSGEERT